MGRPAQISASRTKEWGIDRVWVELLGAVWLEDARSQCGDAGPAGLAGRGIVERHAAHMHPMAFTLEIDRMGGMVLLPCRDGSSPGCADSGLVLAWHQRAPTFDRAPCWPHASAPRRPRRHS